MSRYFETPLISTSTFVFNHFNPKLDLISVALITDHILSYTCKDEPEVIEAVKTHLLAVKAPVAHPLSRFRPPVFE